MEIYLVSDALVYGIEAAMPHKMPNGPAKPVGFVACTFTDAEMNYSQIEKEGELLVYLE